MFTVERRKQVRAQLLKLTEEDSNVVGAAITGSAAREAEDRWSDVDLFFGVSPGVEVNRVLSGWSEYVYLELGALHHFDLHAGPAVYRAFLLEDLLEVDLGFTPASGFGPLGDGEFRVVFGETVARQSSTADADHLVGLVWHHVAHARVSIERGALWQAEYWISALRDHTMELACLRLGYPTAHAKGMDRLPASVTDLAQKALVREVERDELFRALSAATAAVLAELRAADTSLSALADKLEKPLWQLAVLS